MRTLLLILLGTFCFMSQLLMAQRTLPTDPPLPPAADREMPYYDRHKIDVSNIRDLYEKLLIADVMIHADGMFDATSKWKLTLLQMILTGSNHHQARSAYQLSLMGVRMEEILAIWSPTYIQSIENPRMKAAFKYIELASPHPSRVTADTHALLRTHFTDRQIAALFDLASVNSALATHDRVLPIPTDDKTLKWAEKNLSKVGWKPGRNASSSKKEQRANAFVGKALDDAHKEVLASWQPGDLTAPAPVFKSDWVNYLTGYDVSQVTFDNDKDGVEDPFDFYPEDYLKWEKPSWDDENRPDPSTKPFDVAAYDYQHYKAPLVPRTKYPYSDRHKFDEEWTRQSSLGTIGMDSYLLKDDRALTIQFKWALFFVYQQTSGCVHCQVHGAYGIFETTEDDYPHDEIPEEDFPEIIAKIQALLDFERAEHLTTAEKAALRLARDAGPLPLSRATAAHIEELRRHYSDREIQEVIANIILTAWLANSMQSQATVTDRESMSWALRNLTPVGWKPGIHIGRPNEQRPFHMSEFYEEVGAKIFTGDVPDARSLWIGVDIPLFVDSDNDGVEDGFDGFPNDPARWEDTDRDGIEDKLDDDIDGDGIPNSKEVEMGIFPYKADSDGDGVDDPTELRAGTNPVDPSKF